MDYSTFFKICITLHAITGFISLIAGTVSVITRKGGAMHKKAGMVFFYGMMIAGVSGVVASLLPDHHNPFLFVVGLFSVYLVLSGYRALRFKKVKMTRELRYDKIISWTMLSIGVVMVIYGLLLVFSSASMGWILIVFGGIGVFNAIADIRAMQDLVSLRKKALRFHIGKITGGYIAAFTAFFVTNQVLPALLSWLLPTIFGIFFIGYWLRKTKPRKKTTTETL